jgi:hypothetical protein
LSANVLFRIRLPRAAARESPPTPWSQVAENVLTIELAVLEMRRTERHGQFALKVEAEISSGAEFMMNSAPAVRRSWNVLR